MTRGKTTQNWKSVWPHGRISSFFWVFPQRNDPLYSSCPESSTNFSVAQFQGYVCRGLCMASCLNMSLCMCVCVGGGEGDEGCAPPGAHAQVPPHQEPVHVCECAPACTCARLCICLYGFVCFFWCGGRARFSPYLQPSVHMMSLPYPGLLLSPLVGGPVT